MSDTDHRLEPLDHAALKVLRATGRAQLMQAVWVYDRPVDRQGLARFHRNFCDSIGNRLVAASPVPFARPRWVRPAGPPPEIRVGQPRPRTEMLDWADGLGRLPIDPEHGPAWWLALQPFTDGGAAVSMIASHVIGDGVGALMAVHEAITGTMRSVPYQRAGRRPIGTAIRGDIGHVLTDLAKSGSTATAAARAAVDALRPSRRPAPMRPEVPVTEEATYSQLSTAVALVPVADWDTRAGQLGGTSSSLLAAVAAHLGHRLGRYRADDTTVTLQIAVNRRTSLADDRAIAMELTRATIKHPADDLVTVRAALRDARRSLDENSDDTLAQLKLLRWLPRSAVRRALDRAFAYSGDLPVSYSYFGDLPPEIARVDGTPAAQFFLRGLDAKVTPTDLERSHGHLVVVSGRLGEHVTISAEAYELGADNSRRRLRRLLDSSLADFDLHGVQL